MVIFSIFFLKATNPWMPLFTSWKVDINMNFFIFWKISEGCIFAFRGSSMSLNPITSYIRWKVCLDTFQKFHYGNQEIKKNKGRLVYTWYRSKEKVLKFWSWATSFLLYWVFVGIIYFAFLRVCSVIEPFSAWSCPTSKFFKIFEK